MNHRLSDRERQLIERAADGLTDNEIARDLGISFGTVATYWNRVRAKFAGSSRTELVASALRCEYDQIIAALQARIAGLNETLEHVPKDAPRLSCNALEQAPGAILVVNDSQEIIFANSSAHELFGFEERKLEEGCLEKLIPERYRERHSAHFKKYAEEARNIRTTLDATALHRSGDEFPVHVSVGPLDDGGERMIMCVVYPCDAVHLN